MSRIVTKSYYIVRIKDRYVTGLFKNSIPKLSKSEENAIRFEYFGLKEMEITLGEVVKYVHSLKKKGYKDITIVSRDILEDIENVDVSLTMWGNILDSSTVDHIKALSDQDGEDGDFEDEIMIHRFVNHVRAVNYKEVIVMAMQWESFSEVKQSNLAINYVGQLHASRFMMMMDYLSNRFLEGKLL